MKHIYLSPHLDDAVFSCGGLIWEQTQQSDEVEIWTICAADPPDRDLSQFAESLHRDWGLTGNFIQTRRLEDSNAAQILGAVPRYFPYQDCIYRRSSSGEFLYVYEEEIFGGLDPEEMDLVDRLVDDLIGELPEHASIYAPLGIGNHVDHELTRKAASRLGRPVVYYADFPYVREPEANDILEIMERSHDWMIKTHTITESGIKKWHQAALEYQSQIPIFWQNQGVLLREIREMVGSKKHLTLWFPVESGSF